ncbi:IclR family transcriptional regulator [Salinibacterium hongtaonis]|uniref:IclR family transcriptional regulator n=1 Tax=Homoserinimonas hongtaonis TaxID=2079791 RepID=UPI00131F0FD6|nr:IclR family transcriptional regulator [Salinibacterium hongtaonis]
MTDTISPARMQVRQDELTSIGIDSVHNPGTSVRKALQLLEAFSGVKRPIGVSELARRAGLPKSTAHRLLSALESGSFVERIGCNYQLSLRAFELGAGVREVRNRGVVGAAFPYLCELFAQTRQVVQLGMLDGNEVVLLEQLHPVSGVRTLDSVGDRLPANCTALGKAILAFSARSAIDAYLKDALTARTQRSVTDPRVFVEHLAVSRQLGVAVEISECHSGLSSIAAPVLVRGRAIGAVSITTASTAFNERALASTLRTVSTQITAALAAA